MFSGSTTTHTVVVPLGALFQVIANSSVSAASVHDRKELVGANGNTAMGRITYVEPKLSRGGHGDVTVVRHLRHQSDCLAEGGAGARLGPQASPVSD